jgi:hypothetical protein
MPAGAPASTAAFSSTGGNSANVRTIYNPYTVPPGATTPGPAPSYSNGLTCPLGSLFYDYGGPDSVSGTTTQLPAAANGAQGQVAVYKYVLYSSTTNPAVTTAPGVVYYIDNTGLVVSGSPTDGYVGATTAGAGQDAAGIMMVNATDLTTLTATLLNNGTSGSGVWICIGGFVKKAAVPSTVVAGDGLYANLQSTGTAWTPFRLITATAVLEKQKIGVALTTAAQIGATGVYTADVRVEMYSIAPY